jgi:hypothetical protein
MKRVSKRVWIFIVVFFLIQCSLIPIFLILAPMIGLDPFEVVEKTTAEDLVVIEGFVLVRRLDGEVWLIEYFGVLLVIETCLSLVWLIRFNGLNMRNWIEFNHLSENIGEASLLPDNPPCDDPL